jgi:hypothetical protein
MSDLYCDNILGTPSDYDFSEGYGEAWDVVEPDFDEWTAEQCLSFLNDQGVSIVNDPDDMKRDELVSELESIGVACYDDENTAELREAYVESVTAGDLGDLGAWREQARETWSDNQVGAPMINYAYPIKLRGDANEAATKLLDLPLTLVRFEHSGEYGLALTGGGMDLSAEICKAYIALGQRPPVHFCDVPRMAGREYSKEFLAVLIESCEIAQRWAQNTIDNLRRMQNEEAA